MPFRLRSSGARAAAVALTLALIAGPAPRLSAAGNDADAGTWRMIVLTSPSQIPVAQPASTASAEYQTELTAIKNAQGQITRTQQQAIDYWSRGGVRAGTSCARDGCARDCRRRPTRTAVSRPGRGQPVRRADVPSPTRPSVAGLQLMAVAQFEALKAAGTQVPIQRASPSDVDGVQRCGRPRPAVVSVGRRRPFRSDGGAVKLLSEQHRGKRKAAEQRQVAIPHRRATQRRGAGLAIGTPSPRSPRGAAPTGCATRPVAALLRRSPRGAARGGNSWSSESPPRPRCWPRRSVRVDADAGRHRHRAAAARSRRPRRDGARGREVSKAVSKPTARDRAATKGDG